MNYEKRNSCSRGQLWLEVKYAEKQAVLNRGGRWCGLKKRWYVPFRADINLFKPWFPSELKRELDDFEKKERVLMGVKVGKKTMKKRFNKRYHKLGEYV